jgi:hypothetical protein
VEEAMTYDPCMPTAEEIEEMMNAKSNPATIRVKLLCGILPMRGYFWLLLDNNSIYHSDGILYQYKDRLIANAFAYAYRHNLHIERDKSLPYHFQEMEVPSTVNWDLSTTAKVESPANMEEALKPLKEFMERIRGVVRTAPYLQSLPLVLAREDAIRILAAYTTLTWNFDSMCKALDQSIALLKQAEASIKTPEGPPNLHVFTHKVGGSL